MKPRVAILALLFFAISCNTTEPPRPGEAVMYLEALDASSTEVWLRLALDAGVQPRTIELRRLPELSAKMIGGQAGDSLTIDSLTLTGTDTLLVDEGLLPNRTYRYQAFRRVSDYYTDQTPPAQITTLDMTSHDFTWEIDTLGVMNSYLLDCAIISENDIWVVGTIYARDSLGNVEDTPHNAARWNGVAWELKRIPFIGTCSAVEYPPITAIWTFSANSILVTNGGAIVRYDGTNAVMDCGVNSLLTGAINKIYANSEQDVYAVGGAGSIVRFNGTSWQRQESGTTVKLRDVTGNPSGSKVWAAGYENDLSRSIVLEYDGQTWRTVRDLPHTLPRYPDSLSGLITSVYAISDRHVHAASSAGMYRFQAGTRGEGKRTWLPPPFSVGLFNRVRGTTLNNIVVVGVAGTIAHNNGISWYQYQQFFDPSGQPNLLGLSTREKMVMAVGYTGDRAIVIRGRK